MEGLGLAAAGRWGLAKLPCSEHAVTVMSPQLKTKNLQFTESKYSRGKKDIPPYNKSLCK